MFCAVCNTPHDYDLGPEEGICLVKGCNGPLIELFSEKRISRSDRLKELASGLVAIGRKQGLNVYLQYGKEEVEELVDHRSPGGPVPPKPLG